MWDKVERVKRMAPSPAAAGLARVRPAPPSAPSRPRLACLKGRSAPHQPRRPSSHLDHRGATAARRLPCRDGESNSQFWESQRLFGAFPAETRAAAQSKAARRLCSRDAGLVLLGVQLPIQGVKGRSAPHQPRQGAAHGWGRHAEWAQRLLGTSPAETILGFGATAARGLSCRDRPHRRTARMCKWMLK